MVRRIGALLVLMAGVTAASAAQPESGGEPKKEQAAKPIDHTSELLPWTGRVDLKSIGTAYSMWLASERILELAAGEPKLADAVRAAKTRRDRYSGGRTAIAAFAQTLGFDIDEITKPAIEANDAKFKEVIGNRGADVVKDQENFERSFSLNSGVSLYLAFQQGYGDNPESAATLDLLTPVSGVRTLKLGKLTSQLEAPASWRVAGGEGSTVLRCTSGGGFGHEVLALFIDALDQPLKEAQEARFWKAMHDPAKYPAGAVPVEIEDRTVGGSRTLQVTIQTASERGGCKMRTIDRQVMLLHERQWIVTVQLQATLYAAADKDMPTSDAVKARLKAMSPVLDKALETIRLRTEAAKPDASPDKK